jgi:hypothetical protein
MAKKWAWLTILGSLVIGVVGANLFARSAVPTLQLAVPCLLLQSAEEANYLTPAKRADLVARVAGSTALDQKDRDIAARMRSECPRL